MLRSIVAHGVQEGMGHVGLESYIFSICHFQEFDHVLPAVHASPTDFSFGSQLFSISSCDIGGFLESLCNQFGIAEWILSPV